MSLVVDASVACKWYLDEPGASSARALAACEKKLVAPDLLVAEVANLLWLRWREGEIRAGQAKAALAHLPDMLDRLVASSELAEAGFAIAHRLDVPVYAGLYLALAERLGTRLVTADRALLAALPGSRWADTAIGLAEAADALPA